MAEADAFHEESEGSLLEEDISFTASKQAPMRTVLQRTTGAELCSGGNKRSRMGAGYVLYIGFEEGDDIGKIQWMVRKILSARLYDGWTTSVTSKGYEILVLLQPALTAELSGGDPGISKAAEQLFAELIECFSSAYNKTRIHHGVFGKDSELRMVNDGPLTIVLERR
jgi:D-aminoacyl-tRNA deacylase